MRIKLSIYTKASTLEVCHLESCYIKLFIYDGVASKIQLLEHLSLSILFNHPS